MKKMKKLCLGFVCMTVCMFFCVGCTPYIIGQKIAEKMSSEEDSYEESYADAEEYDYSTETYDDIDLDYEEDMDSYEEEYEESSDVDDYEDSDVDFGVISDSIITDYTWQGANDGSLIVCEVGETFRYFQSADDLEDNYYEGTYEFYVGEQAVTYITTALSEYGVTEEELEDLFARNEEYETENFVCLVLHNDACIVDGENTVEEPYTTPYFGFCLEEDGVLCLDIANMNTANYHTYIAQ